MGKKIINVILFLLVTAGCILLTWFMGQGQGFNLILIYNIVFLGIMILIYFIALVSGIRIMDNVTEDLKEAGLDLKEYFDTASNPAKNLREQLSELFEEHFLAKKMEGFMTGMQRSEEGLVDLEEYINEEELDNHIHKKILEIVPDVLTSLGILGTFVGLIWGLKDFSPSSYETMTTSVGSLLDGIKVAFLTSIYGVSLSIAYNYTLRSGYSNMIGRLQDFLSGFHSYIMPSAESKSRNMLIASQKQQTEALSAMIGKLSENMVEQFTLMATPVFSQMNQTLADLSRSIAGNHEDAMREITKGFLNEMHMSFDQEFDNMKVTMDAVMKSQKDNIAFTQEMYRGFSEKMTQIFEEHENRVQESTEKFISTQNQALAAAKDVLVESAKIQEKQQEDYQKLVDYLHSAEKSSAKFWIACNQAMEKYVSAAGDGMEKFTSVGEKCDKMVESNSKLLEDLQSNVLRMTEAEEKTAELMKDMTRFFEEIAVLSDEKDIYMVGGKLGSLAAQNSNQEAFEQVREILEEQGDEQKLRLDDMSRSMRELVRVAKKPKKGLFS